MSLRKPITIFTDCSRVEIYGQVKADKKCLVKFRADVLKAFKGIFSFDLLNNSYKKSLFQTLIEKNQIKTLFIAPFMLFLNGKTLLQSTG